MTAHTKSSGLSTSKANARAMLKEKRATTLTQFLVTRFIIQCAKETKSTLVSQDVKETHKFTVKTARSRHNQREKSLIVVAEVVRTIFIALCFRHGHINEDFVRIVVAELTMTRRVSNLAMKIMNDGNINNGSQILARTKMLRRLQAMQKHAGNQSVPTACPAGGDAWD